MYTSRPNRLIAAVFLLVIFKCQNVLLSQNTLYILDRYSNSVLNIPTSDPTPNASTFISNGLLNAYDLTFNPGNQTLYWVDGQSGMLHFADIFESQIQPLSNTAVSNPVDCDLDLSSGKIWWIDNQGKQILRAGLEGGGQEIVADLKYSNLSAIALHPGQGLYFFADIDSNTIWSSSMLEFNPKPIVFHDIESPVRLLVDTIRQKLYWVDDELHKIERANFDGSERELFYKGGESEFPYGILLDQEEALLYWTDYGLGTVFVANLDGTEITQLNISGLVDPIGIVKGPPPQSPQPKIRTPQVSPSISAFPNPANNILNFVSGIPAQNMEQIKLFDARGNQIYEVDHLNDRSFIVDISSMPDGIYTYTVFVASKYVSGRFSIVR